MPNKSTDGVPVKEAEHSPLRDEGVPVSVDDVPEERPESSETKSGQKATTTKKEK